MPDNSDNIAAIDDAISSGVLMTSIDGVVTRFRSLEEMQKIRRDLVAADTSGTYSTQKKRRWWSLNMGGVKQ